jgi:hypothetical protein
MGIVAKIICDNPISHEKADEMTGLLRNIATF